MHKLIKLEMKINLLEANILRKKKSGQKHYIDVLMYLHYLLVLDKAKIYIN